MSLNFQAEPPIIVVATVGSLCQMLEKQILKLESMKVMVIDEVISLVSCYFQNEINLRVEILTL